MRRLTATLFALALLAFVPPAQAESVRVVASFSILADFVERIGGERIALTTLVGADEDAHVYQPTPGDARAVAEADVVFVNGLEFEGWLPRLISASGFDGPVIEAAMGIDALPFDGAHGHSHGSGDAHVDGNSHGHDEGDTRSHDHHDHGHTHDHDHGHYDDHADQHAAVDGQEAGHDDGGHHHHHGEYDPHVWHSPRMAHVYVDNIVSGLSRVDPEGAAGFQARAQAVRTMIDEVDAQVHALLERIPDVDRIIVTSHDAFQYFGDAYSLRFLAPQGVSTEAEASAADVARLIRQIRDEDVTAVFVENITDTRLIEQISRETGARVGGVLYSDALSGPEGPAPTWADMMIHNARTLTEALARPN